MKQWQAKQEVSVIKKKKKIFIKNQCNKKGNKRYNLKKEYEIKDFKKNKNLKDCYDSIDLPKKFCSF